MMLQPHVQPSHTGYMCDIGECTLLCCAFCDLMYVYMKTELCGAHPSGVHYPVTYIHSVNYVICTDLLTVFCLQQPVTGITVTC